MNPSRVSRDLAHTVCAFSQPPNRLFDDAIKAGIAEQLLEQKNKPFVVSVMGQTGVGKSSLINALFNTRLKVDAVRPTTKDVEPVQVKNAKGHTIVFYDMPGMGESERADKVYLASYRKQLLDSDVVLWTIHADNRSTTFDAQIIKNLLADMEVEQRRALLSKMTLVLTKVDMLAQAPWIMGYMDDAATFGPGEGTKRIIEQKALYYQELFVHVYGESIVSRTYNDVNFALKDPAFTYSDKSVCYQGLLTQETVRTFKQNYPQYAQIFDRLYDNYRVIPCSALFKYNLPELMLVITNKLGPNVFESFKQVFNVDRQSIDIELLDRVPLERARKMCNICVVDIQDKCKVFDMGDGTFLSEKLAGWFQERKRSSWLRSVLPGFFSHGLGM